MESHLHIWKNTQDSSAFLVLEEDWKFASSVQRAPRTIEHALHVREEYAAIGYCGVDMSCTQAYVMKSSAAKKLACFDRCMSHDYCPVDWFIASLYGAGLLTARMFPYTGHSVHTSNLFGSGVIRQSTEGRRLHRTFPFYHNTCERAVAAFQAKCSAF